MKKRTDLGDVLGWGKKECADIDARAFLGLYRRTGNGIFIWHAYKVYRRDGVAVPEWVHVLLDQIAARLLKAKGQPEVVAALEMTSAKGGPQGATRARETLRTREIVAAVHKQLWPNNPQRPMAVYRSVGARFRKTPKQVGDMYRAWLAASGPRKTVQLTRLTDR